jgi:hypothetical protein
MPFLGERQAARGNGVTEGGLPFVQESIRVTGAGPQGTEDRYRKDQRGTLQMP